MCADSFRATLKVSVKPSGSCSGPQREYENLSKLRTGLSTSNNMVHKTQLGRWSCSDRVRRVFGFLQRPHPDILVKHTLLSLYRPQ
jgi:hypothetical protein